ncbi:MAG TPA: BamA/TamA family outer membrane protein [Burkholderiales bacterium]|nr:BamA/TamA family outer membrane protein [Burkholderiales bacterium]
MTPHTPLMALFGAIALPVILIGLYWPIALHAADTADANANTPLQPGYLVKKIESRYSDAFDKGLPPTPSPENGGDLGELDRQAVSDSKEPDKKREIVIVPIPSLNPTLGWGLAVPLMAIYKPASESRDSPPWTTGIAGSYSENGTWAAAAFHKMNLKNDTWRMLMAAGYADVNYDFFGVGSEAGDTNQSIPLNQQVTGGLFEVLRETFTDWYVGLRLLYGRTDVRLDTDLPQLPPGSPPLPEILLSSKLAAVGLRVQYDSRDNQFYPTEGSLFDVKVDQFTDTLGSDFNYTSNSLAYNRYLGLGDRQVLALRGITAFSSGDAPFFALARIGGTDLRGYISGQYIDRMMFAVQGEYRRGLTERFGVVVFAGVGEVAPDVGDLNSDNLLPSVGAGIRYRISKQHPINFRVDIARGKDDTAIYVGVGEAF